jgi:hypothetical protein
MGQLIGIKQDWSPRGLNNVGVDYEDTFSHVVKPATIRLIMPLAVSSNLMFIMLFFTVFSRKKFSCSNRLGTKISIHHGMFVNLTRLYMDSSKHHVLGIQR